jgi:SSS family solute:Na+ symporter
MWIIQTFPAVVFSVFTRFFNGWALLAGWAAGILTATWLAALNHFTVSIWPIHVLGYTMPSYIAFATVILNAVVATILSPVFNAISSDRAADATVAADYG